MNIVSGVSKAIILIGIVITYLFSILNQVYQVQSIMEGIMCGLLLMWAVETLSETKVE